MNINYIKNKLVKGDKNVQKFDESKLLEQPDKAKNELGMFNYWSEKKRSGISDIATISKLILDFDEGMTRDEARERYKEYSYIVYNSASNDTSKGLFKFRMIFDLKEPIDAQSLRHWRSRLFKDMFSSADISSFSIGRFFYVPSKYDKGGDRIVISRHDGKPFDFYEKYPHYEENEMFNRIRQAMMMKPNLISSNLTEEETSENIEKLKSLILANNYTHYPYMGYVVGAAKYRLHLDCANAFQIFKDHYQGNVKMKECEKNFKKLWGIV